MGVIVTEGRGVVYQCEWEKIVISYPALSDDIAFGISNSCSSQYRTTSCRQITSISILGTVDLDRKLRATSDG